METRWWDESKMELLEAAVPNGNLTSIFGLIPREYSHKVHEKMRFSDKLRNNV
jgi:hypothetical protein